MRTPSIGIAFIGALSMCGLLLAACPTPRGGRGDGGGVGQTWTCSANYYGTGDGCDCGCSVADPDCAGLAACVTPSCSAADCQYCYDANGTSIGCIGGGSCGDGVCDSGETPATCASDCESTAVWSCSPSFYGVGDGCDCGCTISDPDCAGLDDCTTPSCSASGCAYCYDASGAAVSCESGGSCGEPCPSGCCSPSGRICCSPPFCAGDCVGSPCC